MNLKEKRIEKNMTQEEISDACGISQCAYSLYEAGKRNPKPSMLKQLAEILDCTVDELLADPEEK